MKIISVLCITLSSVPKNLTLSSFLIALIENQEFSMFVQSATFVVRRFCKVYDYIEQKERLKLE